MELNCNISEVVMPVERLVWRNLTTTIIRAMIRAMSINGIEEQYFIILDTFHAFNSSSLL